jgi:hypothetical protein
MLYLRAGGLMLTALLALAGWSPPADTNPSPMARTFASWDGVRALKCIPCGHGSPGTTISLYGLAMDGAERTRWTREVNRDVIRAVVSSDERVALLESSYRAVTVVCADPAKDKTWDLRELLTNEELAAHVSMTVSHAGWYNRNTRFQFEDDSFVIYLDWGKKLILKP